MSTTILAASSDPLAGIKHAINYLTQPYYFITLAVVIFILMFVLYKWWTKPAVAGLLFALFLIAYFGSLEDPNFRLIVAKPDNVPITIMVISVMICIWLGFRRAALNDSRIAAGAPLLEEE